MTLICLQLQRDSLQRCRIVSSTKIQKAVHDGLPLSSTLKLQKTAKGSAIEIKEIKQVPNKIYWKAQAKQIAKIDQEYYKKLCNPRYQDIIKNLLLFIFQSFSYSSYSMKNDYQRQLAIKILSLITTMFFTVVVEDILVMTLFMFVTVKCCAEILIFCLFQTIYYYWAYLNIKARINYNHQHLNNFINTFTYSLIIIITLRTFSTIFMLSTYQSKQGAIQGLTMLIWIFVIACVVPKLLILVYVKRKQDSLNKLLV